LIASRNKTSRTVTKKKSKNIRNTPNTSQAKSQKSKPDQTPYRGEYQSIDASKHPFLPNKDLHRTRELG
jgi:hypothetical protein